MLSLIHNGNLKEVTVDVMVFFCFSRPPFFPLAATEEGEGIIAIGEICEMIFRARCNMWKSFRRCKVFP
jgi:hypothetical protein